MSGPAGRDAGGTRVAAAALLRAAARGEQGGAPFLTVRQDQGGARRVTLGPELTVGRGAAAALRLDDLGVSRLHARFRLGPEGATVEDLGSKNGVRRNGRPIPAGPCALRPGDAVVVGETTLLFEDPLAEPEPEGAAPAASPAGRDEGLAASPAAGGAAFRREVRRLGPVPWMAGAALLLALAGLLLVAGG